MSNHDDMCFASCPILISFSQVAFSLWLSRANSSTGRLVFGGVDTNKFTGELETLPAVYDSGTASYDYPQITLSDVTMIRSKSTKTLSNTQLTMLIDSGTASLWLPGYVVNPVYEAFNVSTNAPDQLAVVPNANLDNSTVFNFTLGTTVISVPISELLNAYNDTHQLFSMYANDLSNSGTLGIAFMRSAYFVFDYTHNQISLAPANFDYPDDNVTVISPNGVAAMDLQGRTSSTASSSPTPTHSKTKAPTGTSSSSPSTTSHSGGGGGGGGLSSGAKIGLGVGLGLGLLVLIAAAACLFMRRRRRNRTRDPNTPAPLSTTKKPIRPSGPNGINGANGTSSPSKFAFLIPRKPLPKGSRNSKNTNYSSSSPSSNHGPYHQNFADTDEDGSHGDHAGSGVGMDGSGRGMPEMSYRLTGPHYSADPAFMRHEMPADESYVDEGVRPGSGLGGEVGREGVR